MPSQIASPTPMPPSRKTGPSSSSGANNGAAPPLPNLRLATPNSPEFFASLNATLAEQQQHQQRPSTPASAAADEDRWSTTSSWPDHDYPVPAPPPPSPVNGFAPEHRWHR